MSHAHPWRSSTASLVLISAIASGAAIAQDSALPSEFQRLHDDLTKPAVVLTVEQGRAALDELTKLNLNASALPSEARIKLLRVEILAHLATGDATRAAERGATLCAEAGGAAEALETAWLSAIAAGNAKEADQIAKQIAKAGGSVDKKTLSRARRQLKAVGRPAPDAQIETSSGSTVALREREGAALLIDVWTLRDKPEQALLDALAKLHSDNADADAFQVIGVSIDAADKHDAAAAFAAEKGIAWNVAYAPPDGDAGNLVDEFDAGLPPWQAVIDKHGLVRAVGDIRSPALQYALRAAIAEARGDFEAVLPHTLDGKQAKPPAVAEAESAAASSGGGGGNSGGQAGSGLPPSKPSDPEAANLLRQARLFRKTGKTTDCKRICQEIIDKYPGTQEAEEAGYILSALPP